MKLRPHNEYDLRARRRIIESIIITDVSIRGKRHFKDVVCRDGRSSVMVAITRRRDTRPLSTCLLFHVLSSTDLIRNLPHAIPQAKCRRLLHKSA